ncbi:TPA: hypothetical protein ACJIWR_000130 [Enterobacter bugandensis]|uniref:hypothetical protein n=1 Tax=Enterobacter bugandensis TaxID=881260 RepID=UPI00200420F6|nr:hypothetical protein [Enterobacter bugandensis]MCK7409825.1 hypothetical protein [Enterobacter bugandensis]
MANKRLPGGRKSAGRISTSAKKLVALKSGSAGVAISELPDTEKLTGKEFFPVVQDNETRKVPLEELSTLISVDGINAQGGNFCLSPVAYRLANSQGSPTTFKAEYLNEAISITYRIYFGTNGYLRLDFSKWDFDFNESQNYKIILTNNSSGEFSIVAPGNGLVINNDGTVGEPEVFRIDTKVTIIEITQSSHDSKLILRRLTPYEPGKDGESAYSFWTSKQPEGADISDEAFLKFMEGKEGEPGKSAYQLWLDEGNEGSEADYLEWQKANISVDGIEPIKGGGVILTQKSKVVIVSNDEVIKPDLNKFINLNYYIVANNCTVTFDLSEWDVQFHELQNIRFSAFANGTGYVTFITPLETMYRLDGSYGVPEIITVKRDTRIFQITQDPYGSHLRVNQVGPIANGSAGASAYDIWAAAQPDGKDTSEEAYLESMEGKKGDDGRSSYQIWLDAGNEGTEDDFLEWLQVNASVEVDPLKTNLVKLNADGLFVNGVHPIIPKFSTSTLNGLLDTFKSLADGTRVYTMQVDLANPLGITQLGGVGIHRYIAAEPQYFFTNENGEYIPAQYFITGSDVTASSVKVTISVIMADKPYKSWSLSTLEEVASIEGGAILQCKVGMRLLAGTTPSQNGMS